MASDLTEKEILQKVFAVCNTHTHTTHTHNNNKQTNKTKTNKTNRNKQK